MRQVRSFSGLLSPEKIDLGDKKEIEDTGQKTKCEEGKIT